LSQLNFPIFYRMFKKHEKLYIFLISLDYYEEKAVKRFHEEIFRDLIYFAIIISAHFQSVRQA